MCPQEQTFSLSIDVEDDKSGETEINIPSRQKSSLYPPMEERTYVWLYRDSCTLSGGSKDPIFPLFEGVVCVDLSGSPVDRGDTVASYMLH